MKIQAYQLTVAAIALGLSAAQPALAQGASYGLGKLEFMNSCAACHGEDGKGNGPMAELLKTGPADLTQLQKRNGGVFPVAATYAMIDGSAALAVHGSREMPAWGMRYRERVANEPEMGPVGVEEYPTMRILALIEYLSQLQE